MGALDSWQAHTTAMGQRLRSEPHHEDREWLSAPFSSGSKGSGSPEEIGKSYLLLPLAFLFSFPPQHPICTLLSTEKIHLYLYLYLYLSILYLYLSTSLISISTYP